jgi:hypothetical protein
LGKAQRLIIELLDIRENIKKGRVDGKAFLKWKRGDFNLKWEIKLQII